MICPFRNTYGLTDCASSFSSFNETIFLFGWKTDVSILATNDIGFAAGTHYGTLSTITQNVTQDITINVPAAYATPHFLPLKAYGFISSLLSADTDFYFRIIGADYVDLFSHVQLTIRISGYSVPSSLSYSVSYVIVNPDTVNTNELPFSTLSPASASTPGNFIGWSRYGLRTHVSPTYTPPGGTGGGYGGDGSGGSNNDDEDYEWGPFYDNFESHFKPRGYFIDPTSYNPWFVFKYLHPPIPYSLLTAIYILNIISVFWGKLSFQMLPKSRDIFDISKHRPGVLT